jgi:hypothetical protein
MRSRSVITGFVLLTLATSGVAAGHEPEATRTVVVAADFIPAGEPIEADMLTLREVFADETNAFALTDPAEAAGTTAAISIVPAQPITPFMLSPLPGAPLSEPALDTRSHAEFVLQEPTARSPSPISAAAVQRFEVPEAHVVLELPYEWFVDVEMREIRIDDDYAEPVYSESGELISDLGGKLFGVSVFEAQAPDQTLLCGLWTHDTPFARSGAKFFGYAGLISGREMWFVEEAEHWTRSELELPAGDTFKVAYGGPSEIGPLEVVHYFIDTGDRYAMFYCSTAPIIHPDDDWLSIAESIELPSIEA